MDGGDWMRCGHGQLFPSAVQESHLFIMTGFIQGTDLNWKVRWHSLYNWGHKADCKGIFFYLQFKNVILLSSVSIHGPFIVVFHPIYQWPSRQRGESYHLSEPGASNAHFKYVINKFIYSLVTKQGLLTQECVHNTVAIALTVSPGQAVKGPVLVAFSSPLFMWKAQLVIVYNAVMKILTSPT